MWKPIYGFSDYYLINEYGDIFSIRKNKKLKPTIDRYGYKKVTLSVNGKSYYKTVHRLVAESYLPKPYGKDVVNHIDENKLNNHVSNLQWVTVKENDNHGTRNERMSNTKSKKPIVHIVNGVEYEYKGVKQASRILGIAHSQISRFCKDERNDAWRYL